MKKILMAAVALTAISATPAMAQQTVDYEVSGNVGAACSALAPASVGAVAFGTIATNSSGQAVGKAATPVEFSIFCNGSSAKVKYSSTGVLTNASGVDDATYTNTIGFVPNVKIGSATVTTAGTSVTSGTLSIGADSQTGTKIASAGSYTGTISITLSPTS